MKLKIEWKAVPGMGLENFDREIPDIGLSRRIRIWKVPETVSADGYFVSVQHGPQPAKIPPCHQLDALLLADCEASGESARMRFLHPGIKEERQWLSSFCTE